MDLLINTFGTRIRSSGERIVLVFPKKSEPRKEYPARRLEKIIILRPSSISMGAVALALEHGIDVVYLGSFGKPVGRIFPSSPKGITELRRAQLTTANSHKTFRLAKEFVKGKSKNQLEFLKYLEIVYKKDFSREVLQASTLLESLQFVSDDIKGRDQLFGIEGYIADKYFSALKKLYKFSGRKPQGRDKFNSALNYGYGILYNEVERACLYVGLDPYLGLYHSERYGKPSLVLDLVEEFRVPIVDSTVFPLFLQKVLPGKENFVRIGKGEYQLSQEGKRKIVEAVYTRLNQVVQLDGKQRSVKSCIEYQIRMLGHVFLEKRAAYTPFSYSVLE